MKKLFFLLLLSPLFLLAQEGMHFEHAASWKDVLTKAKAENKYIFVDCFTTWCGPCTYMTKNIFPQKEVGNFYNDKFINVKLQLDTTANDNEEVKKWYADGHAIAEKYNIRAYPTFLFFSPDGKIVHRQVGGGPANMFIGFGKDALNPETQYYTLVEKYKAGNKDPQFLLNLAKAAQKAYDAEGISKYGDAYLATQKDLFTKENLEFISSFTQSSKDKGFTIIKDNVAKYDAVKGKGAADKLLTQIILQEEIYPAFRSAAGSEPDWTKITTAVSQKYPAQADQAMATAKVMYYQSTGDWPNFQNVIVNYMKQYSDGLTAMDLNNYAWTVFENCKDGTCLAEALQWSKQSLKDGDNAMFLDTYANLLYKLGRKEEAIAMEEKAVALATANEKVNYREMVDKMKKGEKTWKE